MAARRMKRVMTKTWMRRDALRRARPMSWRQGARDWFAVRGTPLPLRASMTAEMKAKVVITRPGWMGEW